MCYYHYIFSSIVKFEILTHMHGDRETILHGIHYQLPITFLMLTNQVKSHKYSLHGMLYTLLRSVR